MIEGLKDTFYRKFFMHYNFLPFSTGEVRPLRAPNRREQGHGALAERAVQMVLPEGEDSPYTIRVVSEILESNGSSSMASVCGGALALMDAGIQIKAPVAGIAMGLVTDGKRSAVLSDILGDEDHLGDMDFKVAGSRAGHHRDPDGPQDRRSRLGGDGEGAGAGASGSAAHPEAHGRGDGERSAGLRAARGSVARTRRASRCSGSSPTASAT